MPMLRYILFIGLAVHLGLAARLNLASAGLWAFRLDEGALVTHYVRLTGLICTYGFFSPQVASPCYLEIGLAGSAPHQEAVPHFASFSSHEARLRFHSFSTMFLTLAPGADERPAPADTALAKRVAKAFARSIAEREAQRVGKPLSYFRVVVYRHPRLWAYAAGKLGTISDLYVCQNEP